MPDTKMDTRFGLGLLELVENDPLLDFFENQKNPKNLKGRYDLVYTFFWAKKLLVSNRAENWSRRVFWDGEFISGVKF